MVISGDTFDRRVINPAISSRNLGTLTTRRVWQAPVSLKRRNFFFSFFFLTRMFVRRVEIIEREWGTVTLLVSYVIEKNCGFVWKRSELDLRIFWKILKKKISRIIIYNSRIIVSVIYQEVINFIDRPLVTVTNYSLFQMNSRTSEKLAKNWFERSDFERLCGSLEK